MPEEAGHRRFEIPKPVAAGDVRDVVIEGQGGQGDGIAKIDGFILFIKGAKKGEKCRVRIIEVKRTFASAERIGSSSDDRDEMEKEVEGERGGPSG